MRFDLKSYVATLIPALNKRDYSNEIAAVKTALDDGVIKNTETLVDLYKTGFQSTEAKKWADTFLQTFSRMGLRYNSFFEGIYALLLNMRSNCDEIERLSIQYMNNDISRTGITYLKANLFRYAELMDFTLRYTNELSVLILHLEAKRQGLHTLNNPTKLDIKFVNENFNNYIDALKVMSVGKAVLAKTMADIPDIPIPEDDVDASIVESSMKGSGDPLKMGFIFDTATFNIFFHLNNLANNWMQSRYDRDVETRRMIELKLEDYKRSQQQNPDPKVQEIIEGYENRLAIIKTRIKAEEQKYGRS